MNKEELIEFLKENLRLEIEQETEQYSQTESVTITLRIGNYVLSEDWITIESGDQQLI